MKAMIFAAGLGTRLRPLTDQIPKALVPVNGMPLLEIQIRKLKSIGINEIIVNVHHMAGEIKKFLKSKDHFGIRIEVSDESDQLLDTGGGIANASWFFKADENFLVHNVDILTNINLGSLVQKHKDTGALATLAVRLRKSSRYLLFDSKNRLTGWKNEKTGELIRCGTATIEKTLAFSGIHVINARIFNLMQNAGKFSIIKTYLSLAPANLIYGLEDSGSYWFDVETLKKLAEAEAFIRQKNIEIV